MNVTAGEECDDGGESATCDADCTVAQCGDGVLNVTSDEECDDGNTDPGDNCSPTCGIEPGEPIPTVSEWGLVVMTLLILAAGTIAINRRQPRVSV